MAFDQILFWALLLFIGVVLPALPAIMRAWRKARRGNTPNSDHEGKQAEKL
jgi:hypothetical protein